jgi:perosamine synthetase
MEFIYKKDRSNLKRSSLIPWFEPQFWGHEKEYVLDALDSLWLSGGSYLEKLSCSFEELLKVKHVLLTSNGTTSLNLAYLAMGLKEGDEILVPGFGFLAAANIAVQMKVKPVFTEVDPQTWCMSVQDIERALTPRTKAVVLVHTYGNLCDMVPILNFTKSHGIKVIEDCAESLFSKYRRHYCGTFGYLNCFSFQATKTLTMGEGGMLVTNEDDEELLRKLRLYHSHGLLTRGSYQHEVPGHNFRLTNYQAAMGLAQLEKKEEIIASRKGVFDSYRNFFSDKYGINIQALTSGVEPVWWAFALKLDPKAFPQGRDAVMAKMKEEGIETRPGFVASTHIPYFQSPSLPICDDLSKSIISLPSFSGLTDEQIFFICQTIIKLRK